MSEENNAAIREAFDAATADGKNADEVKVEMIKAGCQFKDTGRLYKEWGIETGIVVDAKERTAKVDDVMSSQGDLDTEDGLSAAMEAIMDDINGTNEKQAGALIRAWAKKNDVDVFKKPKGGGGVRKSSFIFVLIERLLDNPSMDESTFDELVAGAETKAASTYRSHYNAVRELANQLSA